MKVVINKVETGISGLDEMLRGGLPEGRVILAAGGPGTGKTIFCTQFLHHGITNKDEKAVFISLDETKPHYIEEMRTFGWDFEALEQEGKFKFVDASNVRRIPDEAKVGRLQVGGKELGMINLLDMIDTEVTKAGVKRVVLDSVSGLVFRFPEPPERRLAVLDIVEALTATGATCLVTSEAISLGENREMQPEEYVSHGVILLQSLQTGERAVRIRKMRGSEVDAIPRPYEIRETGIEVYPSQNVYQA
jgi:KaiC/GvpD/RAD55 family RecA-like ATPase